MATTYTITSNVITGFTGATPSGDIDLSSYTTVTAINSGSFNRAGITSILLPPNLTSLGDSAFQNCSGITSITIPSSVTQIGNLVFRGCSNLVSIDIPNNVTSVGHSLFFGCGNLVTVTIGSGLTNLISICFLTVVLYPVLPSQLPSRQLVMRRFRIVLSSEA